MSKMTLPSYPDDSHLHFNSVVMMVVEMVMGLGLVMRMKVRVIDFQLLTD